jgi:uncharacterized protein YcbX
MTARVAWIHVAPVKGLAVAERDEVFVERFGVRENRRFYLIGDDGRLLNGKQLGPLVRVDADWDEDTRMLGLAFPDGTRTAGWVELGERVMTNFYGVREVEGHVVTGPWADALSEFVGVSLRLVEPVVPGAGNDRGLGAVSLLSNASLDALRAAAGETNPVDARRFRMLFGIDGVAAHEEDSWRGRALRIGGATIRVRGNVGRCIVTSRDPDTGMRNLATLDVLAEYRSGVETTEPLPFGVWGEVVRPGPVGVGDGVELED